MWACDFYNFRMVYHFTSEQKARDYGNRSGFQFTVYKMENV